MSDITPEDTERWTNEVNAIMERDGVTNEQADQGLKWAIADYATKQAAIARLEAAVAELKATLGL